MKKTSEFVTFRELQRAVEALPSPEEYYLGDIYYAQIYRHEILVSSDAESPLEGASKLETIAFECAEFPTGKRWIFKGNFVVANEISELEKDENKV
jgi:hypothetical protein